ncbi:bacteriohemerythrin [Magnetospirillum sp. SS-4]|uniref:bacteriohemerythrin n=1 Tax=Magnetospirillum sp. SS-4 TaxID=2681465 RepID=UPI00137D5BA0|nr:bacteriohemerythrin [Magnetospirillum sp. SS-4]CAA7617563.1 Hemerythrin [Magnetospirillum sp. SS-4]
MAVISWSEMMSVGVPVLDDDHKTLVGFINLLQHSIGDPEEYVAVYSVLGALEDYCLHHFLREEKMMEAGRCPQLDQHHRTHEGFAETVRALKARYEEDQSSVRARDCLTFLNDWLVNHICTTDMNYRAWLVGHAGAKAVGETMSLADQRLDSGPTDWRRLRILVVDDNPNFCGILTAILNGVGVSSITVSHDLAAGKMALIGQPLDLLISDWHVGTESGLDLVKWLRQCPPPLCGLPVLMLSGHERMINRDLALLAGADEFMEKPVAARSLLICLSRLAAKVR